MGKSILEGKMDGKKEGERIRRLQERDVCDAFNNPITEVKRLTLDRERFQCKKIDRLGQTIQLPTLKTEEY